MKKITLIALLFALIWQVNAQTLENSLQRKNEVKLDVAYLIGGAIKVEYEYLLNDYSSIGISALYNFDTRNNNGYPRVYKAQVLGIYRLYFGKEPIRGFFLEGNFGLIHGEYTIYTQNWPWPTEKYTAFGAGIALGWKWHMPNSNIVLDIFCGLGRKLGGSDVVNRGWAYPRAGIAIGKRF